MARDLSNRLRQQLFQPFRDEEIKVLLEINHSSFSAPLRFVSDVDDLVSNGETYTAFPFEINLPTDDENEPGATVRIENVDDRIGTTLLNLNTDPVTVDIKVVLRSTPDVIEAEWSEFELVDVEITGIFVSGRLVVRGQVLEPTPGRVLTSSISPVFFR